MSAACTPRSSLSQEEAAHLHVVGTLAQRPFEQDDFHHLLFTPKLPAEVGMKHMRGEDLPRYIELGGLETGRDGEVWMVGLADRVTQGVVDLHSSDDGLTHHSNGVLLHWIDVDGALVREMRDAVVVKIEWPLPKNSTSNAVGQVTFAFGGQVCEEQCDVRAYSLIL